MVTFPPLPNFDRPPVIEVVLSLQFEGAALQVQHIGLLWQRFRDRFPQVQTKPPLDPVIEDLRKQPSRALRFELAEMPLLPRTWFIAASGDELIQIQADRFIHNWRKTGEGDEYPRYEHIRKCFEDELSEFMGFIKEQGLGNVKPNQCEITYVNHIALGPHGLTHADASKVFRLIRDMPTSFWDQPESLQFASRYVVQHPVTNEPFARLYVEMTPALSADKREPKFVMNLMARGAPAGESIVDVLEFFDLARSYIVCGFTAMTSTEMHNNWGKRE